MKVTVVIPSLAGVTQDYLKVCVESIRAAGLDWDIIVVTNGSKDKPDLSGIFGITIHLHTRDQGQAIATNIGVAASAPDTDYILVSNDDMYYAPGWDKKLKFPSLCFSPNLVEPTNNKGSAPPFLKFDGGFTLDEFKKEETDSFINKTIDEFGIPLIFQEDGFNLPFFISRNLWNDIGGYDIAYDPWGSNSDTDLQTKIELAGVKPQRLREVLVYHFSSKSGTFEGHQEFWQNNWDYYTDKWGFNRDGTEGDPWYCKNMIDYDKLKYHPDWKGKYDKA